MAITRAEVDIKKVLILVVLLLKTSGLRSRSRGWQKDAVSRPNLYATTELFPRHMRVNSLDELVAIDQLRLAKSGSEVSLGRCFRRLRTLDELK